MQRLDVGDASSRVEQANKPTQFDVVIQDLEQYDNCETSWILSNHELSQTSHSELRPLTADIQKAQEGNFISRLWHSSAIEAQLGEVKDKISNALDELRVS